VVSERNNIRFELPSVTIGRPLTTKGIYIYVHISIDYWCFCLICIVKKTLNIKTRGLSHCGLAIYIKVDLKAKEELWKLSMQKYNLQKIL
jgi:hypothetical protein